MIPAGEQLVLDTNLRVAKRGRDVCIATRRYAMHRLVDQVGPAGPPRGAGLPAVEFQKLDMAAPIRRLAS